MLYRRKNKKRTSYDVDEFLKCVFIVNFILLVFTLISNCYNCFRAAHYMAFEYAIVFVLLLLLLILRLYYRLLTLITFIL